MLPEKLPASSPWPLPPPPYRHSAASYMSPRPQRDRPLTGVRQYSHSECYPDIKVLSFPMSTIATSYFKHMTSAQLAAVQHIHIFANRARLTAKDPGRYISYSAFAELGCLRGKKEKKDGDREGPYGMGGPFLKTMTMTVRDCDWRFRYEAWQGIIMFENRHWENVLGELKELRMQLEIEDQNQEELVPIIKKLKDFEFNIGRGESLVAEENVQENTWMEPIQRRVHDPPANKWDETTYYVATIVWKVRSIGQGSAD